MSHTQTQAFVQRGSRHCRECEKCVLGFDHHCKWVNACIGTNNYRPFLALLSSMCTMLLVQLAAGINNLVECFTAAADMDVRLHAAYPAPISLNGYTAALCCYILLVLVALYGLGDLLLLHLVLIARGMTTYDYIMAYHDAALASAASAAAAAGGQGGTAGQSVQQQQAAGGGGGLAATLHKLAAYRPRSIRVRDDSGLPENSSSNPFDKGGSVASGGSPVRLVLPSVSKKHHLRAHASLTPCHACLLPQSAIAARQHGGSAYQQPGGGSASSSPRRPAAAAQQQSQPQIVEPPLSPLRQHRPQLSTLNSSNRQPS